MYSLKKLKFEYHNLEPYIDTHIIGLHYNKRHNNYLKALKKILESNNYDFSYPLEKRYCHLDELKEENKNDILFNLDGVVNHNLY